MANLGRIHFRLPIGPKHLEIDRWPSHYAQEPCAVKVSIHKQGTRNGLNWWWNLRIQNWVVGMCGPVWCCTVLLHLICVGVWWLASWYLFCLCISFATSNSNIIRPESTQQRTEYHSHSFIQFFVDSARPFFPILRLACWQQRPSRATWTNSSPNATHFWSQCFRSCSLWDGQFLWV